MELYEIEMVYIEEIYIFIGFVEDVNCFVCYNVNKGFMNLGFELKFEEEEINLIVLNGLCIDMKNYDFFFVKGNGYVKVMNVEKLVDDDFVFNF